MKIGIRDGCLQQPWQKVFGIGREVGFDGIELDLGASYEETMLWSQEGRVRLAGVVAESGIELASLCTGVCWTYSPASDSAGTRERIHRVLSATCTFAAELGARWILVPVTPGDEGCQPRGRHRAVDRDDGGGSRRSRPISASCSASRTSGAATASPPRNWPTW